MNLSIDIVIFDMDGTITKPVIDWQVVRSRIGVPPESTIMGHIRRLLNGEREAAESILLEVELEATDRVELNDGFHDLFEAIRQRKLKTAVVTNNHGAAMHNVLDQHELRFDAALSRDDGELKPAPDLIHLALDRTETEPERALGVGDSHLDVSACTAAGVKCVYLDHGDRRFSHIPSVTALAEIIPLLEPDLCA